MSYDSKPILKFRVAMIGFSVVVFVLALVSLVVWLTGRV